MSQQHFVDGYLKRLHYSGPVLPNIETLKELHKRHMLMVPFENLSNVIGEEYASTKSQLFEKIILGQRGGLCFELNSLFAFLLQDLGFEVMIVKAAVYIDQSFQAVPGHQLSIVTLEGEEWAVDVSFGDGFTTPLRLMGDEIQDDGYVSYRLRKTVDEKNHECYTVESPQHSDDVFLSMNHMEEKVADCVQIVWEYRYRLYVKPCTMDDFQEVRYSVSHDPNGDFNQGLICTILRPWGRLTLSRFKLVRKYVENKKWKKEVQVLGSMEEVWGVLEKEFGVKPPKCEIPIEVSTDNTRQIP